MINYPELVSKCYVGGQPRNLYKPIPCHTKPHLGPTVKMVCRQLVVFNLTIIWVIFDS